MGAKNLSLIYIATDLGPVHIRQSPYCLLYFIAQEKKSITFNDQSKKLSLYEIIMEGLERPRTYQRNDNLFNTHGDSGILGIIEKLICTRASYFLGLQGYCAKHSSYTRDIVAIRDEESKESELEWQVNISKLKREYVESFGHVEAPQARETHEGAERPDVDEEGKEEEETNAEVEEDT